LVPDGSLIVGWGVHGYPLEIQALFYAALQVTNSAEAENKTYLAGDA